MTNQELTPDEKVLYIHSMNIDRIAAIRIGNLVFAMSVHRTDKMTLKQWVDMNDQIINGCIKSISFYETFGVDYFDATDEMKKTNFELKKYPIKYIYHGIKM